MACRLSKATIIDLYQADYSLASISRVADVSREYIRKVVKKEGLRPRGARLAEIRAERSRMAEEMAAKKRADRLDRRQMRRQQMADWLREAQRKWDAGATIQEIADYYNLSLRSMSWYMHCARTKLGSPWFAHRSTASLGRVRREEVLAESQDLRRRWRSGESMIHIASSYGWSKRRLRSFMERVRSICGIKALPLRTMVQSVHHPDRLAVRSKDAMRRLYQEGRMMAPLWSEGLTMRQTASRLGMPYHRVSTVICAMRKADPSFGFQRRMKARSTTKRRGQQD